MPIANVSLSDTFDVWRTRTNQLIVQAEQMIIVANSSFEKTNSIAISANAWTNTVVAGANAWSNTKVSSVTGTAGQIYSSGGTTPTLNLITTSVSAATYGGSSQIPVFTVDTYGRLTTAANVTVQGMDYVYANTIGAASNGWVNTSVAGANAWSNTVFDYANTKFLANSTTTYSGTLTVVGTLNITGSVSQAKANVLSQTLTDSATISWDTSAGQVATVTLGGNRTMAAPTNLKVGTYILNVIQDGTGSRTLTWNSVFKWPAGVAPTLTTTASARDVMSFFSDGTNLYGTYINDVK